jgi:Ca2+-binding RTX toxin-like protein
LLTENITLTLGSKGAQTVVSSNSAKSEAKGDKIANFEQVVTGDGNDSITGSDSDDYIYASNGNDLVQGLAGADNLSGEGGTDTLTYDKSAKGVTVDLSGGFGEGGDADGDLVSGFEILTGSKFNDVLRADANTQKIDGGLGDDIIQSSVNAQVLIGGMGVNTLSYAGDIKGVTVALTAGKAADLSGNAGGNHTEGDTATGFVNLIGGSGIDKLTGDTGNNVIEGGSGGDTLKGGGGIDTLSYASDETGVVVTIGGTVANGHAQGDAITWTSFRNLTGGTKGDTLNGDTNANTIRGEGGNDDIQGDDGNDILNGGAGDDSIEGGGHNDTIDGGEGDDFDLVGGAGNDTILGGAGDDWIGDGEDEVGNDIMDGGAGNDWLAGGAGNDKITGGTGDDFIYGFGGADTMDGGEGIDTLEYGIPVGGDGFLTIDLQANTVVVSGKDQDLIDEAKGDKIKNFENIEADDSNDTLRGTAGVNEIVGGGGNDLIEGRAGADDLDGEGNGGAGDTVSYEGSSQGVTVDLTAAGPQVSKGDADGDILDDFENILGSAKDDALTGGNGDNTIAGGKGNDSIQGDDGSDILDGGEGVDTLDYSYSADATHTVTLGLANVVTKDTGDGGDDQDSVKNFENIIGGDKDDTFVGNSMTNVIIGGAGNDTLDGGAGNDTLDGGAGDDTLIAGGGIDTLSYLSVTSGVTVNLSKSIGQGTVGAGIDTLVGTFTNLIGSDKDDGLTGNSEANKIEGRGGKDIMLGGGGADTFDGGADADTIDYTALGVGKSVTIALAEAGKTATVSGSAVAEIGADRLIDIESVWGGNGNDVFTGNSADNLFDGGDGADTLTGGFGMDDLFGGNGTDFFRYTKAAEGGDTILDFTAGDKITIVKSGFGIPAGVKIGGALANDFAAEYFVSGTDPAANKGHGQFLFDTDAGGSTSALYWDADGDDDGAAVLIATFVDGPTITANDFDLK